MASTAKPTAQRLKKISDRKIHIVTNGPVIDGPPGSECSKEPASPSPTDHLVIRPQSIPKFSKKYITRQHPSVEIIGTRLRQCKDMESFASLARVFVGVVQGNILPSISRLPFINKADDEYRAREFIVTDRCRMLLEQVNKRRSGDVASAITKALALLDMIFDALNELIHVAEQLFFAGKPLPSIPEVEDDSDTCSLIGSIASFLEEPDEEVQMARRSLSVIVEDVLIESAGQDPTWDARSSCAFSIIDVPVEGKRAVHFADPFSPRPQRHADRFGTGISQRIYQLQQVVQRSKSSLTLRSFSSRNSTKTFPVDYELEDEGAVSWKDTNSIRSIKTPYSLRQSCLFSFIEGEPRVDMPMPSYGDVYTDPEGKLMQTSFDAFFLQVTSNLVLEKPYLVPFFFRCFRYFSTAVELAEKLEARFCENPPEALTPEQLKVWVRSNEGTKHRVRNLLQTWLEVFWEPELDEGAVASLLQFSLTHLHTLNDANTVRVFTLIIGAGKGFKSRAAHLKSIRETLKNGPTVPVPRPSGFRFDIDRYTSILSLKMFMCENGREELARQLTIRIAGIFGQLDATEAARAWFLDVPPPPSVKEVLTELFDWNNRLSLFVTSTILQAGEHSVGTQTSVLSFWMDIAMELLRLNNINGAVAVFQGVDCTTARRAKKAIFAVDLAHKTIHRIIYKLFFTFGVKSDYNRVLAGLRTKAVRISCSGLVQLFLKQFVVGRLVFIDDFKKNLAGAKYSHDSTLSTLPPNIINFMPYHVVNTTIDAIEAAQQLEYKFSTDSSIQIWLDRVLSPFSARNAAQVLDEQSDKLHPRVPEYQGIDAWTHTLSNKKPEPIARLRINFDKIFAIYQHDEDPQGSKERRATIAMLQAR
ncbi:ras GEF [Hymenopellis radicata]|nr:ras GEF [Hymenopellis radicata]